MNINILPQINLPQNILTKQVTKPATTVIEQPNYASYTADNVLASKGLNFKGNKPLNKLYDEYNWYIRHDRVSPIDAFLKMEESHEVMDNFLTEIFKTDDRSKELLDSIAYQPRRAKEFREKLKEKVGENSPNAHTIFYDSPYMKVYEKYIEDKYNNEHSISGLLKMRPDWRGSALLEKFKQMGKNPEDFYIGDIPNDFPRDHFDRITDYLSGQMEFGYKTQKNIDSLELDGRRYDFKYFTEGRSDKNVFGVFTPDKRKYVFKMGDPEKRSLDDPFALGTLAKIDRYLTTNRSPNSAPHCYYNHKKNISIYKYIEHSPVKENPNNLETIKNHLPDFDALGLAYNDSVGNKNCFLLDRVYDDSVDAHGAISRQEWISVDNDHVTYSNPFQPLITKFHAPLPNAMQMFF